MALEIERKFLVAGSGWRTQVAPGIVYCQGYIATAVSGQSVRVRVAGDRGYLTLKGPSLNASGLTRREFEYEIPVSDAREMLAALCQRPAIEKTRYQLQLGDIVWEIDEFEGENKGLIVAEVELQAEDQPFEQPEWLGPEVSGQARYYNASLVEMPYSQWAD